MLSQVQPQSPNLITDLLLPVLPWVVVFVTVFVFVTRAAKAQRKIQVEHAERMRQHMIAVEAKLDKLIEQGERSAIR